MSVESNQSQSLFSVQQMNFLGTYLRDMMMSVMQNVATPEDALNTTMSKMNKAKKQKKETPSRKEEHPKKKRKVEAAAGSAYQLHQQKIQDEDEHYDDDGDDHEDFPAKEEDSDEEDGDKSHDLSRQSKGDLKDEEKQEESMNLSMAEQLKRIQSYFPDKIVASKPQRSRVIRPEETQRDPSIEALPLHELIQENLKQIQSEVVAGKSSSNKETSSMEKSVFPNTYKLRKKYKMSDMPDFDQNYKEDSNIYSLVHEYNKAKLSKIQQQNAMNMKTAGRINSELKKSLSVNSWGIWFLMANKMLMENLYKRLNSDEIDFDEVVQEVKMAANLNCGALNAAKESALFTSMGIAVDTLAQRDQYLNVMDRDMPKEAAQKLRSAPFDGQTLFHGQIDEAKKSLKEVKESKERTITVKIDAPKGNDYKGKAKNEYQNRNFYQKSGYQAKNDQGKNQFQNQYQNQSQPDKNQNDKNQSNNFRGSRFNQTRFNSRGRGYQGRNYDPSKARGRGGAFKGRQS
jgi:hypothetical protein